MMRLFRLSRKRYAKEFSGKGAAIMGGRWNSKGVEVVYTAESRALAMAEVLVHLSLAILPGDYMMVEIEIPKSLEILELDLNDLPEYWNVFPVASASQKMGNSFIESGDYCIFKVPSSVVKGDFNYLLNPHHPDLYKIKIYDITDFPFDNRIFE